MAGQTPDQQFPWHDIYDAHCHPTDTLANIQSIPSMHARILLIMATRGEDQALVADAASRYGVSIEEIHSTATSLQHRVVPAFGWHPWFSYQMFFAGDFDGAKELTPQQKHSHYHSVLSPSPGDDDADTMHTLPDPLQFESYLHSLEQQLVKFPLALLGEVGLDKSFRIPTAWAADQLEGRDTSLTPGGREGRKLTPFRVDMEHQRRVLLAQLAIAGKYRRAASVHGVQAHGILHDTLASLWKGHERPSMSKRQRKKRQDEPRSASDIEDDKGQELPFPPRICLHSYSGPAEAVSQYVAARVPCDVYFSFSVTINNWNEAGTGKVESAVRAVPDDRILIESDLHTAGDDMDRYLRQAAEQVCAVKGWELNSGIAQLARNWKRFVTGIE